MTWLRVDDKFPRHPKVSALTDREFRVHVRLLCWCSEYGTEGNIPDGAFLEVAGLTRKMGRRFLDLGLWDVADGCPVIHDFEKYRPKDPSNADRQRAWRERNAPRNAPVTDEVTETVTIETSRARDRAAAPVPVPALDLGGSLKGSTGSTEAKSPARTATPAKPKNQKPVVSDEVEHAITKMCNGLRRVDSQTPNVIRSLFAGKLPPAAFHLAHESAVEHGGDIGYAIGALKSMVEEGQYA